MLKVARRQLPGLGSGMVALEDIPADEVLLSVPLPVAIASPEGGDEAPWSIGMAGQLLELAARGGAATWLAALPPAPALPWLGWSTEEVWQLQDEDTVGEVHHMQSLAAAAVAELGASGHARADVEWALAMVHSRSFVSGGQHVWVPGVDVCNHAEAPNAAVRLVHSPGACQGLSAEEEVAPPSPVTRQPSRFELLTTKEVAAGEQVCISYGAWASDVFLLFFGFVPGDSSAPGGNPHEEAVLFGGLEDMAMFQQELQAEAAAATVGAENFSFVWEPQPCQAWETVEERGVRELEEEEAIVQQLEQDLGSSRQQYYRLVVTAAGMEQRLYNAASALLQRCRCQGSPPSVGRFLAARCRELLASYPTSLAEDERLLRQLELESTSNGSEDSGGSAGSADSAGGGAEAGGSEGGGAESSDSAGAGRAGGGAESGVTRERLALAHSLGC